MAYILVGISDSSSPLVLGIEYRFRLKPMQGDLRYVAFFINAHEQTL